MSGIIKVLIAIVVAVLAYKAFNHFYVADGEFREVANDLREPSSSFLSSVYHMCVDIVVDIFNAIKGVFSKNA